MMNELLNFGTIPRPMKAAMSPQRCLQSLLFDEMFEIVFFPLPPQNVPGNHFLARKKKTDEPQTGKHIFPWKSTVKQYVGKYFWRCFCAAAERPMAKVESARHVMTRRDTISGAARSKTDF
jgi:hypothetical protein